MPGYRRDKARKKQKRANVQRLPKPAPNPNYPTKQQLALRLLETFEAHHPDVRVHVIAADALYGVAAFVDAASALFGGVQVLSQIRSNQNIRIGKTGAARGRLFCHPSRHPPAPSVSEAVRKSWPWSAVPAYTSAPIKPNAWWWRFNMKTKKTYRYLIASDLSWRTLDIVQGHSFEMARGGFYSGTGKGHEGWAQLTKQPGEEGARQRVILSLLVDHSLFVHPEQQAQLKNNLPAYTVGSLRANVQMACWVDVIDDLVSSENPQDQLKRFHPSLARRVCV